MAIARTSARVAGTLFFVVAGLVACHRGSPSDFTRESALSTARKEHPEASLPSDELPAGVTAYEDVAYASRDGGALELDLYVPTAAGVHPAVLMVHGGGWESGSRVMERPFAKRLAALGYVTASVSYRLGPAGRYPNALHDLKAAVRWLRANADSYAIDPKHIGAVGGSAGGQLVALLGATNGRSHLEGDIAGDSPRATSELQAVVVIDGLADFTGKALLEKEVGEPGAPTRFLGGPFKSRAGVWREASAITHVSPQSAPTLFIESGARRPILPGRPEMCEKLLAIGVACERVQTPGAPHPFWLVNPWFEPTLRTAERFLRKYLGATGPLR